MLRHNILSELQPEALLTFSQAAEILNVDVSFIPRLVRDSKLPSVRLGTRRRIPRWALRAYEEREIALSLDALNAITGNKNSTGA